MTAAQPPRKDSIVTPAESASALRALLEQHALGNLTQLFVDNGLRVEDLKDLTEADLRELGLSMGDRKRVLRLQAALRGGASARPAVAEDVAERRQITVVFADMVGSTALSARLDPEDLREVVRSYQQAVAAAVDAYGGYVAQHLGDGAVAYFGWPEARENDAERAVRAAIAIVAGVKALSPSLPEPIATRIGVATGRVVVGDVLYNQDSVERPVIGETPNLAARLQGVADVNSIVISAATRRMIGGLFEVADLGEMDLKGFSRPVRAYRVDRESSDVERFRALRGSRLSPFVGRERERETLTNAWHEATHGSARVVHLVSEAGMGKSRLAHWLRDYARDDGASELRFDCSAYHGASAFYPIIRHLESSAGILRDDDAAARWAKLASLCATSGLSSDVALPVLAKLLQVPIPDGVPVPRLEPIQEKEIVINSLIGRIKHQARLGPTLLTVEDLHWIDPSSTELFTRLLSEIASLPLMVLLCYRPETTPTWALGESSPVIELSRLEPESCRELVQSLAEAGAVSKDMVEQIVARTDGVPLFVEELTSTVVESGLGNATRDDGSVDAAIPATLHDSLLARLDRLGDIKRIAQVAACIGREFRRELLQQVSGLSHPSLDEALERLVASTLVQADVESDSNRFVFKHALVQHTAYESLLRSRRVVYHRAIAGALEGEVAETEPEIIAQHYSRAGVVDKEIDWWLRSGQRALRTSAYLEALQHLTNGMKAIERLPKKDPVRELQMVAHLAVPMVLTRGWANEDVGAAYRRAYDLAKSLGQPPELFPTLSGILSYYLVRGEFAHAYTLAHENYGIAERSGDPELILEAAHDRGTCSLYMGKFDEASRFLGQAAEIFDPARHAHHAFLYSKLAGPSAMAHQLLIHAVRGDREGAKAVAERSLADAEAGNHAFSRLWVLTGLCVAHIIFGDYEALAQVSARQIAESQELGFPNWLAQGFVWSGCAQAALGDVEPGIALIRQGLGIWHMTGAELMKPFMLTRLAEALLIAGRLDEAEETYWQVVSTMDATGEIWAAPDSHRLGAEIARRRLGKNHASVGSRVQLAREMAKRTGATLYEAAIDRDEARALAT
ncbi:MAG TPA: adenylate/guanylate cyclase domain-containing protein [Gemmatimonadaceae bacterium]|nr:adenylate/guanylate cyclase domain-containing protein [Gemmatimonadaceae bacterium]